MFQQASWGGSALISRKHCRLLHGIHRYVSTVDGHPYQGLRWKLCGLLTSMTATFSKTHITINWRDFRTCGGVSGDVCEGKGNSDLDCVWPFLIL